MEETTTEADDSYEELAVSDDFDRLFGIVVDGFVGAVGGLVGIALLTGALFVAESLGGFHRASFANLGHFVGLEAVGPAVLVGYLIFLGHGLVTWPLLFASLKHYLPGNVDPASGLVFGTVLWTGFAIGFYDGYTGRALVVYLALTLVGHWAYGVGLGTVFHYLTSRPDSLV